ncbi:hypothetical protein Q0Z83_081540 [Actinoplanes sichuanensis]|uniref:Uncharacterized protein n=1 Tax=Actinoplanes sichuanensis TaxID=512349 RepID=A0ABW4ACP7_9ACTN|nr:hypothetical protein [Actinoplanes sichuanensis]BEL09963.1 hypothetical protein Q0Z83_081540 [Actinoplanes sichuanensis]
MRNMIQLLGGVAVAGAVAAGSTAFTASGLSGAPASTFVGGKASLGVKGAVMSSFAFDFDGSDPNKITGLHFNLMDDAGAALSTSPQPTVVVTVTGDVTNATDATPTCVRTTNTWQCNADGSSAYFTALTNVAVQVS